MPAPASATAARHPRIRIAVAGEHGSDSDSRQTAIIRLERSVRPRWALVACTLHRDTMTPLPRLRGLEDEWILYEGHCLVLEQGDGQRLLEALGDDLHSLQRRITEGLIVFDRDGVQWGRYDDDASHADYALQRRSVRVHDCLPRIIGATTHTVADWLGAEAWADLEGLRAQDVVARAAARGVRLFGGVERVNAYLQRRRVAATGGAGQSVF